MNPIEKHEICKICKEYVNQKCSLMKCMDCYKQILFSRFGKCPKDKWKVEELKI